MSVKKGDTVSVNYTGKFDNGEIFDSSDKSGVPLSFTVGSGQVIKGFDDAVLDMNFGEEKTVVISPKEGYGESQGELINKVPRNKLPAGELSEGMQLMVTLPNGMKFPARLTNVKTDDVTIDLNHPLAGKTLYFTIKVLGLK